MVKPTPMLRGGLIAVAPDAGITDNKLLMEGTCEGMVASGLSVKLTKCAIRIKLNINSSITNFTLDGASLYNATKNCYPFSNVSDETAYNVTSEVSPSSGVVTLYAFPRSVAGCTSGDDKTLCLIVRGKYNGGTSTYYRVNVKKTGTTQVLNRNTAYAITISSVAGSGYTTVNDAYNSADSRIGYGIDDWDDTDLNEAIVYGANNTSLHVNRQAVTLGFAKDEQQVVTATVGGNGVSCNSATTSEIWLSVTNNENQYTFKTLSANTTDKDRSATVDITTSNGLIIPITVVQKKLRVEDFKLELTSEPTIGADATSKSFTITTAGAGVVPVATVTNSWSVSSISENSLTIAPPGGAQPINASAPARSCKLTLTCNVNGGSLSRDFTIVQNGREAKLEPYATNKVIPFDCDGEARTYKFTTSYGSLASVEVENNPTWVTKAENLVNKEFTITASPQNVFGAPARSCMVKVTGQNGAVYRFKVEQEPVVVASGSEGVMPSDGSVYWFNRNVGAASSLFFTNVKPDDPNNSYEAVGTYIASPSSATCPTGYRVPTATELSGLATSLEKYNHTNGFYVFYFDGANEQGAKRRVFFPLGGYDVTLDLTGQYLNNPAIYYQTLKAGYYWSSEVQSGTTYKALKLGDDAASSSATDATVSYATSGSDARKLLVRCVKDK